MIRPEGPGYHGTETPEEYLERVAQMPSATRRIDAEALSDAPGTPVPRAFSEAPQSPAEARRWLRSQGWSIGTRGRLSKEHWAAYNAR